MTLLLLEPPLLPAAAPAPTPIRLEGLVSPVSPLEQLFYYHNRLASQLTGIGAICDRHEFLSEEDHADLSGFIGAAFDACSGIGRLLYGG